MKNSSIIVAIDTDTLAEAQSWFDRLDPTLCKIKIGKELFTRCGPPVVKLAVEKGYDVFLDLKFHDIPNTVEKAVLAACDLGVWMVNVHAMGGPRMMSAARRAVDNSGSNPYLIAVTVLTSIDQNELNTIGFQGSTNVIVRNLAQLAFNSGLDGVVCSALEAPIIKELNINKLTVTPGIRLASRTDDDQQRVMTPKLAKINGSDYLVIGRPITQAVDPILTLQEILIDFAI